MEYKKRRDSFNKDRESKFTQKVLAGKRTYFLDVKSTQKNDLYLTITERKKIFDGRGDSVVRKHKIFLYKEDFDNFTEALQECINFVKQNVNQDEKTGFEGQDPRNPNDSNDSDDSNSSDGWYD